MVKITSLCTGCVQPVTNPICPFCFSRHVTVWLRDKRLPGYKVSNIKKHLKRMVQEAEETPSDIKCIICMSKKVNLCTYCFILKATRIITKNLGEGKLLTQFNEDFNTEIWRVTPIY